MTKKAILLTFDYELFQGVRSGTVANCMLRPTDKILDILAKHRANSIFFIDMMYMVRLKEAAKKYPKAKSDFEKIEQQIIRMADNGHYVFNHLHPHWLDAVYREETNDWQLTDTLKYSFSSLSEEKRAYVFDSTMQLLNDILQKAKTELKADGFRAGGLYIQPFLAFKPHFDKHGIKFDFSVLIGATGALENKTGSFDFSGIKKPVYNFATDIAVENKDGDFREYALEIAHIPFPLRLMNSVFYRLNSKKLNHQKYGDGVSTHNKINFPQGGPLSATETFSIEILNAVKVPFYLSHLNHSGFLHILSHPKLVSDYSLEVMDQFLERIRKNESAEFDFKKFTLPG